MATYIQIGSTVTVGAGGAASIDFSSIPSTYTDLLLKVSVRGTQAQNEVGLDISFNSSTASFTGRYLQGYNSATSSGTTTRNVGSLNAATSTASTFTNIEIYIPNYASANNKSYSVDAVDENNSALATAVLVAGLWSNSAAINAISFACNAGNFAQYSTASLYGISKS